MTRYHTIFRRIAAWLIDFAPFLPALIVGGTYYRYAHGTMLGVVWTLVLSLCGIGYSIYFHGLYGATPGKSLMKLRVVSVKNEETIGFRYAIIREVPWMFMGVLGAIEDHWAAPSTAYVISILTGCWLFADDLVAIIHPQRRALHDIVAGTVVIKEEPNQALRPTSTVVTSAADAPAAPTAAAADL